MKVLIDNGHGENTPGKRSPDGRLREWAYSREIADMVVVGLRKLGIDAERIVKEDTDVPLSERCRRANAIYKEAGKKAILVSIHCNAAGNGSSWMSAKGWSVFVSNNASSNSKKLADCLGQVAECIPVPVRKQMPGREYWEQNLAICRDTNCPSNIRLKKVLLLHPSRIRKEQKLMKHYPLLCSSSRIDLILLVIRLMFC